MPAPRMLTPTHEVQLQRCGDICMTCCAPLAAGWRDRAGSATSTAAARREAPAAAGRGAKRPCPAPESPMHAARAKAPRLGGRMRTTPASSAGMTCTLFTGPDQRCRVLLAVALAACSCAIINVPPGPIDSFFDDTCLVHVCF